MKTSTKIKRIRALEDKARALRNRIDLINNEWEILLADIAETPEWAADCQARGLVTDPTFGDVLC